ncbi:acyl-CoA dehydrogenase [Burkholderia sp. MSh2]|uniref:3-methylmercaptopropionyl-CoA dehydrogenase n=1 Tax=Burkholderia paludis TaxID=1506587 RepID=A0A6J5DF47_9BURK|nr:MULTISPECIES: acyl-CoA dehydrogenase C-terminal domain-containing protein [Burkholderia]KEZ01895.1 acyl-CoA dehydrogenase [Burkholderia sp. MSh2]CAB3752869.1 3-methylmercaptopropionyl-CoA dehydrogenase [Burkholderia paludis]VWB95234.1 acyl-CoA dehydrogenase [Burkholderia paludis]
MIKYRPPVRDMQFLLHELLNVESRFSAMPRHSDLDAGTVDQIIEAAGKFSRDVLQPLNLPGDREGCTRDANGSVRTPAGYPEAYRQYVEGGWPALTGPAEFGGQALPHVVGNAVTEMICACNQAWGAYPILSHGAGSCLFEHGNAELKRLYLPKLVSGAWSGTMCLTEAHCGSDLGLLGTRAELAADGSYRITGTKIFISGGDQDLTDNILHLVLARLPDAPAGSRGISLFLVPKFLVNERGEPVERNAVQCGALEEKMGIHGNATCVMNFDGARGWLVGERGRGLNAMFVMMNASRLVVATQTVGLSEFVYQQASGYAKERLQSRSASGPRLPAAAADPIIVHPDVRRMLLTQRAYTEGGRALTAWLAVLADHEQSDADETRRAAAARLIPLLTPIAKAFVSDNAFESTNLGMQVFGGHGYIVETGIEQYVRDARISSIYEGTNAIQALDLVNRKIAVDGGASLDLLLADIEGFVENSRAAPAMNEFSTPLLAAIDKARRGTSAILDGQRRDPEFAGAAAVHYTRVIGHLLFAYLWAQMARVALAKCGHDDDFYRTKLATARYYFARMHPEIDYQLALVLASPASLMEPADEAF